jgi:hypothetical protein
MMTDQHYSKIASLDSESSFMNILDDEFKNSMQIIIAECIGTIPKNYSVCLVFVYFKRNYFIWDLD